MRTRTSHLCLLMLAFTALPLSASTRLIFPQIVLQQGRFSGLAIANPTSGPVSITLNAYTSEGILFTASGVTNPVIKPLAAGEQYVALAKQIFSPPPSVGEAPTPTRLWVEVTSATDGLTGFFLDGDDSYNFMDGSDVGSSGIELILPIVENNPPVTTEIALINPTEDAAEASIEFLRKDGTAASAVQKKTLRSRAALLGPLSTLFPVSYGEVAALKIVGSRPLVCYGYLHRSTDNSLITVPAQDTALAAKTLYFPQLAVGDSWVTTVGVVNTTKNDETVTITAYEGNGTLYAAPGLNNPVTKLIPKNGILRETARNLFGFSASPLREGWIKVEAVRPALYGYVEYGAGTNRALVSAQLEAHTRAIFSYQALRPPYFTGLAILNPSSLTTNVEVVSIGQDGRPLGKAQRALRPGERQSKLVEQWVSSAAGAPGGAVFVKSDNPVIATQLFGTSSLSLLANVPPQKITTSYDPAKNLGTVTVKPPLAVVETGKTVKFQASGASGLSWFLDGSGDVGSVTADGTYRAPSKTPGKHSVTIGARNAAGDLSGGASINVVQREEIASGLATITAVAYFENAQRFFIAEQQVIGAPQDSERRRAATNAQILEQDKVTGNRSIYLTFPGDSLGKMLPYVDSKKQNWLLVAGTTSGKIYRINLDTKQQSVIAEGLNKPNSMTLDGSGDLLVAVENGIEIVQRAKFDAALSGAGRAAMRRLSAASARKAIDIQSPRGVAADFCSGAVYVTTADGALWEYIGKNRRDVLNGGRLADPNEIFILYLDGETKCQEATILLICESKGVAIVLPSESLGFEFVGDENFPRDLEFFPDDSPFSRNGEAAVVIAEDNQITAAGVGGLYSENDPISDEDVEFGDTEFPHIDPEGDTLEVTSPSLGYKVPDIVSVDALDLKDSVLIGIGFSDSVVPVAQGVPNGVDILIEFDSDANFLTGDWSVFNNWTLFGETFLGVDWWVKSYTSKIVEYTTRKEYPVDITYLNDLVVVEIPKSIVDLSFGHLVLGVGNWEEGTDIAPNAMYLDLGLLGPTYGTASDRDLALEQKLLQAERLPAPPRRPRAVRRGTRQSQGNSEVTLARSNDVLGEKSGKSGK